MAILLNNFGVSLGLDEASSINNDFSKTIYAIANGVDKKRATKELGLVETGTWCTTVISTAEESLLNHSSRNNGLRIRCLEFFNLLVTMSAEHAEEINKFVTSNYGILGELFAAIIVKWSRERLERYVQKAREYVRRHITTTCNLTDRLTMEYAVLIATANIARKRLGISISIKNILSILLGHHEVILKDADPALNLYDCILNYISSNRSKFPKAKGLSDFSVAEGVLDNGYYFVGIKTFEKIMEMNGFSDPKVSINQLAAKGYLEKNTDRNYYTKRIGGIPLKCYKIYIVPSKDKTGKERK
ncbi:MAG: DUF927 domain-containing protein [Ruminococcus sp.]|nr:DUF927 domain-containing protein [Ruminococcus sp.]